MSLEEIKSILLQYKRALEDKYHINTLGIFGSYARGEQNLGSDIDILVDFSHPISLFDFIDMEDELSGILKIKVDLVSRDSLKPYIGEHILKEVQIL